MVEEWSSSKRFNPFNSMKLLSQLYRWREIERGVIVPAPDLVTIDPINACDLRCTWCNADYILKHNKHYLNEESMKHIAASLTHWNNHPKYGGVEAVCIAGGGEPLLNPATGSLIRELVNRGIEAGVVTNGVGINRHMEDLSQCYWVGVSVDAGTPETFLTLKKRDYFSKVIKNITELVRYSADNKTPLALPGRARGVSYKFLLHPGNVQDVYEAARIAKDIGCRNLHIRPAGATWDKIEVGPSIFSYADIQHFQQQLEKARSIEDSSFGVFGITHKFDGDFSRKNEFKDCHAIFMTAVFMPPKKKISDKKIGFSLGLCCDRRGDAALTLPDMKDFSQVRGFWGSKNHWKMFDAIKVQNCPRCTYQPHNQIYEGCVEEDNLSYEFI